MMKTYKSELSRSNFKDDPILKQITFNRYAFSVKQANTTKYKIVKRLNELGLSEREMRTWFNQTLADGTSSGVIPKSKVTSTSNIDNNVPINNNSVHGEVQVKTEHDVVPEYEYEYEYEEDVPPPTIYDIIHEEYPSSKNIDKPNEKLMLKTYKILTQPKKYGVDESYNFVDVYNALYNHQVEAKKYKYGYINQTINGKNVSVPVVVPPAPVQPTPQPKRFKKWTI